MSTVLITGGAGYIGSVVNLMLHEIGFKTVIIDNLSNGKLDNVKCGELIIGDIGDVEKLRHIFKSFNIDIVMHFAASADVNESMYNPSLFFRNNTCNTLQLLDIMLSRGCHRIINSSTAAVYGNPQAIPITENHPLVPCNVYGESKLMVEKILDWYHKRYYLQFNSFRYFNVAGQYKGLKENRKCETHLLPVIADCVKHNRPVPIYGNNYPTRDGTCIRDYIHVVDVAKAHILAIDNLNKNSDQHYNLGTGHGYSVYEVIDTVSKYMSKTVDVEYKNKRYGDPPVLVADSSKFKHDTGWMPTHSEDILTTIKEYLYE